MITLTHLELEKVKKEGMEVFTQEQYNRFLETNMEVLQKGEANTLDELEKAEYEELKEEIKSFAEALVYSPSKESEFRLEKSIYYIRPKQVEWDEPELIKGEDGEDIQKARSGRYTDTPLNRKLGRVGQQYGSKKEKQEGSEIKIGEAGSKGDFDSNKVYKVTKGHPAKGDILYSGDKFKISNDRKIVSVLPKGEKEWEDYKFDEIFPEGEMTGGEKKDVTSPYKKGDKLEHNGETIHVGHDTSGGQSTITYKAPSVSDKTYYDLDKLKKVIEENKVTDDKGKSETKDEK